MNASDVDNGGGQIGLLIGLKNQSLLATRVAKFESKVFPEVGIYTSPVLIKKYMFVGCREENGKMMSQRSVLEYQRMTLK